MTMTNLLPGLRNGALAGGLIFLAMSPGSPASSARTISERQAANPQGIVEIFCLAGAVEVDAWDRAEVEVSGTVDDSVERVELTGSGDRTSVRVVMRGSSSHMGAVAQLRIHIPAKSSVSTTFVSANLNIAGVQGEAKLQTISGDISGDVGGNLRINGVSGSVRIKAPQAHIVEVETISGDIELSGGSGDVEVTTVSGSAKVKVGTLERGRFRTVSGSITAELAVTADGRLEGESVSGALAFDFSAEPSAEFDVQSFSGTIDNCFGPKPTQPSYGPGSRLTFKNADGRGRVHIDSQSGSVRLCAKNVRERAATDGAKVSPLSNVRPCPPNPFYVI
jgi:Putative adhesin